jgi:hypothetical protein
MAKARMINTRFWDDNYTSNLDPIEKLVFLYVLTNTSTNICGIYEIPLKKIANETGLDKEMVIKILKRFTDDEKVFYLDGWLGIKNFIKNQNEKSPMVKAGIDRELREAPQNIVNLVIGEGIDTLSHLTKPNLTKPNLTKPNAEEDSQGSSGENIFVNELINSFKSVNPSYQVLFSRKNQRESCKRLIEKHGVEFLQKITAVLERTNGTPYFPNITTPSQLEEKMGNLMAALQKQKSKNNNGLDLGMI